MVDGTWGMGDLVGRGPGAAQRPGPAAADLTTAAARPQGAPAPTTGAPEGQAETGRRRGTTAALGLLTVVALVAFALYAASLASRADEVGEAQPITVPGAGPAGPFGAGQRAPELALAGLDGQTVRLSEFAGRPVWINFWASWCAPCRAEMPDIDAVYREIRAKEAQAGTTDGLALLLVSIGEDPAVVRRYLDSAGYRLPVLVDPDFAITARYRVNGLPTHYFIGRDGVIRDLAVGGLKPGAMRARLARIM